MPWGWTDVDIFISYRRSDTQDLAGRIADHLDTVDEIDSVFIDVKNIRKGEVFEAKTDRELAGSNTCIVLIGKQWLGKRDEIKSRIFDDDDFVRGEVSLALKSKVKVFPVLVNGAEMPATEDLPADLAQLNKINAAHLDHVSFDQDIDTLVGAIIGDPNYQRNRPVWRKLFRSGLRSLLGAIAGLIAFMLFALIHSVLTDERPLTETVGGLAGVFAIALIFIIVGALFPLWRRRR